MRPLSSSDKHHAHKAVAEYPIFTAPHRITVHGMLTSEHSNLSLSFVPQPIWFGLSLPASPSLFLSNSHSFFSLSYPFSLTISTSPLALTNKPVNIQFRIGLSTMTSPVHIVNPQSVCGMQGVWERHNCYCASFRDNNMRPALNSEDCDW